MRRFPSNSERRVFLQSRTSVDITTLNTNHFVWETDTPFDIVLSSFLYKLENNHVPTTGCFPNVREFANQDTIAGKSRMVSRSKRVDDLGLATQWTYRANHRTVDAFAGLPVKFFTCSTLKLMTAAFAGDILVGSHQRGGHRPCRNHKCFCDKSFEK